MIHLSAKQTNVPTALPNGISQKHNHGLANKGTEDLDTEQPYHGGGLSRPLTDYASARTYASQGQRIAPADSDVPADRTWNDNTMTVSDTGSCQEDQVSETHRIVASGSRSPNGMYVKLLIRIFFDHDYGSGLTIKLNSSRHCCHPPTIDFTKSIGQGILFLLLF